MPKFKLDWQWVKRWRWLIVAGGLGLILFGVILRQLLYPINQTLPNTTVSGQSVGRRSRSDLTVMVGEQLNKSSIVFVDGSFTKTVKIADLLPPVDPTEAVVWPNYKTWERLIPFSLWWRQDKIDDFTISSDHKQIREILNDIAQARNQAPVEAELIIHDGMVEITDSKNGRELDIAASVQKLHDQSLHLGGETRIGLVFKNISPLRTGADMTNLKTRAEALIDQSISFMAPSGIVVKTSSEEKASWLKVMAGKDNHLELEIDKTKFVQYATAKLNPLVYQAPTPTIVNLFDGQETSRQVGQAGLTVDPEAIINLLNQSWLKGQAKQYKILTKAVASPVRTTSNYSHSQLGLQTYYNTLDRQNIKVFFKQFGGNGWQASSGANDQMVAASTYKLFVALRLFDEINSGRTTWQDQVINDKNVEECLKSMIVVSDNACPEAWLSQWGRSSLNNYLYGWGISRQTTFTDPTAARTTAQDLAMLLEGLYHQTWFRMGDAALLNSHMTNQIYRRGIPAGSSGSVADKVGFLNGYLHDAALVFHPRGNYLLVILTKNQTWAKIAEITRQTEAIIYP